MLTLQTQCSDKGACHLVVHACRNTASLLASWGMARRAKRSRAGATFSVDSFDDEASHAADAAQAFYLVEDPEGLEALADTTLVVEGKQLPVHSQVGSAVYAAALLCSMRGPATLPYQHGSLEAWQHTGLSHSRRALELLPSLAATVVQVLSVHSRVLRDMFVDTGSQGAASQSGSKVSRRASAHCQLHALVLIY